MPRGRVERERDALDEAEDVQLPRGDDPVSARTQSTAACSASTASTTTIIRRRSTRSAIEPPTSASAVTGSVWTSASAPTATGEPVSSRTSQYAAICCIHVPMNEMPLPAK